MTHEMDGDESSSDTDSISLLCSLGGSHTKGAAKEMVLAEFEVPDSASCTGECTNASNSTPNPGLKASQHVNIPPKALLNKIDGYGETLLHKACKRNNPTQVVALLQAGINVNVQDFAGWTALHEASAVGDLEVVRLLLEAGANVNARSKDGITPLHDAAYSGHYQVVKLLLQYGSYASVKTLSGLSAMDLAEEENIKMLLQASLAREESANAHNRPAESQGASQLHTQMNHSHNEPSNACSGESANTDAATKTGDSQLKRKEITDTNDSSHPTVIEVLLEEAGSRQAEIAHWPLACPGDADRLHAALMQIQKMLIEALAKQELAKEALAQKFRNVPNHFLQLVYKSQIVSLASRQRTLVKMIQDHKGLVTKYMNTYNQAGQGGTPEVTQLSHVSSLPTKSVEVLKDAAAWTHTDVPEGTCQSSVTHPVQTSQHIDFETQQEHTQTLPICENDRRHLSELMEAGVLPRYSTLRLSLKGQVHVARVLTKGTLKDGRGKQFLTPTDWFQSMMGNNVPVSSAYVWDKVTYRGRPLSYYLLNTEAAGNTAQTCTEEAAPHRNTRYSPEEEVTEAAALKRLMNIRIIHLVNDEEMMPISVLDSHWERVLSEDW